MARRTNSPYLSRPVTRQGWWAAALASAFIAMFIINAAAFGPADEGAWWRQNLLPFYGIAMLLVVLAGGVMGLVALVRMRERSWVVWLSVVPGVLVVVFLLGELLNPH